MLFIALIGCGRMGKIYAKAIAAHQKATLVAICDQDYNLAKETGKEVGITNIFSDYKEVAKIKNIDAVIIASSTNTHKDIIFEMVKAKKHILCEKPIAISLEDTKKVVKLLSKSEIKFQLGFMRRFDAAYLEAKRMIENNEIGKPVLFMGISRDPVAPPFEYAKPEVCGDILMDLNIHDFDIAMWLMNSDIEWVFSQKCALVYKELKSINASDTSITYLQFKNGAMGYIEGNRYSVGGYDVRAEIVGDRGCVKVGYYRDKSVLLFNKNGMNYKCVPWFIERFTDAYIAQIESFFNCLINDKEPLVGALDGLKAQEVVIMANQSAINKNKVSIIDL